MKKHIELIGLFVVILALIFTAGCSKDDPTEPDAPSVTPPPPNPDSLYQLTFKGTITYDTAFELRNPCMEIWIDGECWRPTGFYPVCKITGLKAKSLQGKNCSVEISSLLFVKGNEWWQVSTVYSPQRIYELVIPAKDIQTLEFSFYCHLPDGK